MDAFDRVYGPDGVPLDGHNIAHMRTSPALLAPELHMWRNAAADEGSRYVEAIRGARAMRQRAAEYLPRSVTVGDNRFVRRADRRLGIPRAWLTR